MTRLQVSSSSQSSSGTTTSSSSSGTSSSSSGTASSSSESDSSASPNSPAPQPARTKITEKETIKPASPPRRRSSAKPKTTATVTPRRNRPSTSEAIEKNGKPPSKSETIRNTRKKKSIFSPDNSSESDAEEKKEPAKPVEPVAPRGKGRPRKSADEKAKTPPKQDDKKRKIVEKRRQSATAKLATRPRPMTPARPASVVTSPTTSKRGGRDSTSCSTISSSSQSDSDSDSEPRQSESNNNNKSNSQSTIRTGKTKPPKLPQQPQDEEQPEMKEATLIQNRKLTRSLSARTSTNTSKSNAVSKPPLSKSSGKKAGPLLLSPRRPTLQTPPQPPVPLSESKCPVPGCDSSGHLNGKRPRHFTWDACPIYHNLTPEWCEKRAIERDTETIARKQALAKPLRAQPSLDQRAYQLKVKDMRSKWRTTNDLDNKDGPCGAGSGSVVGDPEDEREAPLEGVVSDYDLKLFRDAQALAAARLEDELAPITVVPQPPNEQRSITRLIQMGKYRMQVWYQSPYPGSASRVPLLYICEFCLQHQRSKQAVKRHRSKCVWRHPPGDEVYRKGDLSVWQVDGRKYKRYCQRLCLLAKFFLDHKTLYYDVEPFLFYVMTLADKEGCHTVGYFSKEKNSFLNYNVSCILTLPPYQRQGYGRLLIDFSYLLTRTEGKVGSPEKPLSDLGLISYRSYWKDALLRRLSSEEGGTLSIRDLSQELAVASYDIVSTLQEMGLMKYWKGKHIVLRKPELLEEFKTRWTRSLRVEPTCLRWRPCSGGGGGGGTR